VTGSTVTNGFEITNDLMSEKACTTDSSDTSKISRVKAQCLHEVWKFKGMRSFGNTPTAYSVGCRMHGRGSGLRLKMQQFALIPELESRWPFIAVNVISLQMPQTISKCVCLMSIFQHVNG
jgi:hypothetical protein